MRLLKINNIEVDIDEQTAIGIDYQAYDVKSPGKRTVNISNTFSIPKTSNNLAIFGNANNPQSLSDTIYSINYCDYWVNNQQFVTHAKIQVQSIDSRINVFIFEKKDIWDQLKEINIPTFTAQFMIYLWNQKGYYNWAGTHYTGTFNDFIDEFSDTDEGLILPFFYNNLHAPIKYSGGEGRIEDIYTIWLDYFYNDADNQINTNGGHWCAFIKTIFEFIEYTYHVDFLTAGGQVDGNIWDDPVALGFFIPLNEICLTGSGTYSACELAFTTSGSNSVFLPYQNLRDKQDKTLFDLVLAFFHHLNIIVDNLEIEGDEVIALRRFDDLPATAQIVNWSGVASVKSFKPQIDGYSQNNIIKFKSVHSDLTELANSRNITCLNENLNFKDDLFEIDSYIPALEQIIIAIDPVTFEPTYDYVYNLSESESFKSFVFLLKGDWTESNIHVGYLKNGVTLDGNRPLRKVELYDLNSEYQTLESALQYPKFYEVEKWLSPSDIKELEFFKMYYFQELNGSFFLNKITGFNPDKSNAPTTLELLRVSDKTPVLPGEIIPYTDGIGDPYTDGIDDLYV
jgi:hypothetical protein